MEQTWFALWWRWCYWEKDKVQWHSSFLLFCGEFGLGGVTEPTGSLERWRDCVGRFRRLLGLMFILWPLFARSFCEYELGLIYQIRVLFSSLGLDPPQLAFHYIPSFLKSLVPKKEKNRQLTCRNGIQYNYVFSEQNRAELDLGIFLLKKLEVVTE